jgi:hypothetical protein
MKLKAPRKIEITRKPKSKTRRVVVVPKKKS